MAQLETLKCEKCSGEMLKSRKYSSGSSLVSMILILIGFLLLFLFPIGTLIGVVFIGFGIKKGIQPRFFWVCQSCGYKFEREGNKKEYF